MFPPFSFAFHLFFVGFLLRSPHSPQFGHRHPRRPPPLEYTTGLSHPGFTAEARRAPLRDGYMLSRRLRFAQRYLELGQVRKPGATCHLAHGRCLASRFPTCDLLQMGWGFLVEVGRVCAWRDGVWGVLVGVAPWRVLVRVGNTPLCDGDCRLCRQPTAHSGFVGFVFPSRFGACRSSSYFMHFRQE